MHSYRQVGIGIILAALAVFVILGGYTLASVEGGINAKETITPTPIIVHPTSVPTMDLSTQR